MLADIDTHIAPKPGKDATSQRLWAQRGTMLLPTRVRLNTVRAMSVRLPIPAIGSAWVPCKVGSEMLEKALCVYLNSSIGIFAMLGNRSNRTPAYPQFSMDDMRKLVVPNFAAIGDAAVAELAAAYDAHAEEILLPLPELDADPVRRALDDAVVSALGLGGETVATIRRSLAMEPSVTGRR